MSLSIMVLWWNIWYRITYTSEHFSMVYNDNGKLLEKYKSVTTHVRNVRTLAIWLHKTKENLAASIMYEIFEHRNVQ